MQYLNALTTDDAFWCRLTLAACFQLAQSVMKIGGIGGGRWAYSRHAVHMAAALSGCRTALVSTETTPLPL